MKKLFALFDRITSALQRLTLDYDLSDKEAKGLSQAADQVNDVRRAYCDRKLRALRLGWVRASKVSGKDGH